MSHDYSVERPLLILSDRAVADALMGCAACGIAGVSPSSLPLGR